MGIRGSIIALLGLIAAALIAAPARADMRVALVIGNSAYRSVPPLTNPQNDAKLMADTLRGIGFTLVGGGALVNLDKAQFDSAVQKFSELIQGADVGLFYYAGHGVQVRGANYLIPVNANPTREADVDFQMVDTALVLRQMEAAGTKLNIVILDACRNNPFGGRGLRATGGGLAQMRAPEGTLISYATQPGNVASDGADGHSPYTKALVQTIRTPGLDLFRAFNEVGLTVMRETGDAQQPWVSTSPINGSFQFVATPAQASAAPAGLPAAPTPSAAPSEAAQVWVTIQSTTSIAVLQTFAARFGDTIYGSMARARIEELKKRQAVAALPPPQLPPVQKTGPAPPPAQADPPGTYEPAVNREGITIRELNLNIPDARICQSLCRSEAQCTAWVYRSPQGRSDGQPHCWLRNNAVRMQGDNLTVSGEVEH
jgi:hypothetical protein